MGRYNLFHFKGIKEEMETTEERKKSESRFFFVDLPLQVALYLKYSL